MELAPTLTKLVPRRRRNSRLAYDAIRQCAWIQDISGDLGPVATMEYVDIWCRLHDRARTRHDLLAVDRERHLLRQVLLPGPLPRLNPSTPLEADLEEWCPHGRQDVHGLSVWTYAGLESASLTTDYPTHRFASFATRNKSPYTISLLDASSLASFGMISSTRAASPLHLRMAAQASSIGGPERSRAHLRVIGKPSECSQHSSPGLYGDIEMHVSSTAPHLLMPTWLATSRRKLAPGRKRVLEGLATSYL